MLDLDQRTILSDENFVYQVNTLVVGQENILNRFDVKFVNGFGEFKSYRLENINNISINQLKQYLGAPDLVKLSDLNYFFDKRKLLKEFGSGSFNSINEATDAVKESFKKIFSGSQKEEIFNTIWSNKNLRNDLFPNLPQNISPQVKKQYFNNEFNNLINATNSKIYNFIIVN